MHDRIEAGTFLMAAGMTGGDLTLQGADAAHLQSVIDVLREAGMKIEKTEQHEVERVEQGRRVSPLVDIFENQDELLVHEIDLDMVREVRDLWQFFRDRRPETYGPLTDS